MGLEIKPVRFWRVLQAYGCQEGLALQDGRHATVLGTLIRANGATGGSHTIIKRATFSLGVSNNTYRAIPLPCCCGGTATSSGPAYGARAASTPCPSLPYYLETWLLFSNCLCTTGSSNRGTCVQLPGECRGAHTVTNHNRNGLRRGSAATLHLSDSLFVWRHCHPRSHRGAEPGATRSVSLVVNSQVQRKCSNCREEIKSCVGSRDTRKIAAGPARIPLLSCRRSSRLGRKSP